jgi:hypothetical protein
LVHKLNLRGCPLSFSSPPPITHTHVHTLATLVDRHTPLQLKSEVASTTPNTMLAVTATSRLCKPRAATCSPRLPQIGRHIPQAPRAEPEAKPSSVDVAEQPTTSGEGKLEMGNSYNAPVLREGQGTAIVTGLVSVILGVGYLWLVWFMDASRSGPMIPPPPEAMGL